MELTSHGIEIDIPRGWDGEIYKRSAGLGALDQSAGETKPVVHLGNFPLKPGRGDFGSGAVEVMGADNILIVLFEYGADSVGTKLFASSGMPSVSADDFAPHTMQRPLPGQSGAQFFFTEQGRAFCLYLVLGSHARRHQLVPEVNLVLSTLNLSTNKPIGSDRSLGIE